MDWQAHAIVSNRTHPFQNLGCNTLVRLALAPCKALPNGLQLLTGGPHQVKCRGRRQQCQAALGLGSCLLGACMPYGELLVQPGACRDTGSRLAVGTDTSRAQAGLTSIWTEYCRFTKISLCSLSSAQGQLKTKSWNAHCPVTCSLSTSAGQTCSLNICLAWGGSLACKHKRVAIIFHVTQGV